MHIASCASQLFFLSTDYLSVDEMVIQSSLIDIKYTFITVYLNTVSPVMRFELLVSVYIVVSQPTQMVHLYVKVMLSISIIVLLKLRYISSIIF